METSVRFVFFLDCFNCVVLLIFVLIFHHNSAIGEWIESSRQEKINSMVFNGVQYVIFIFAIIIIHIVFLASMTKKHEITDRYFIRLLPDSKWICLFFL